MYGVCLLHWLPWWAVLEANEVITYCVLLCGTCLDALSADSVSASPYFKWHGLFCLFSLASNVITRSSFIISWWLCCDITLSTNTLYSFPHWQHTHRLLLLSLSDVYYFFSVFVPWAKCTSASLRWRQVEGHQKLDMPQSSMQDDAPIFMEAVNLVLERPLVGHLMP